MVSMESPCRAGGKTLKIMLGEVNSLGCKSDSQDSMGHADNEDL